MAEKPESSTEEVKRLRRCINDLVSIHALPATWSGSERSRISGNLLEALLNMLSLDFVYARLRGTAGQDMELMRTSSMWKPKPRTQEIREMLQPWSGNESENWPRTVRTAIDGREMSVVSLQLGVYGELGLIVAGSKRVDFPQQTEELVLSVAANQAAIGLREANLLSALDQRVAERTAELVVANEELRREISDRKEKEEKLRLNEEALRESENATRLIVDYIPGLITVLTPNGDFERVNLPVLDYFGKPFEDLKLWMTNDSIHPEDRTQVIRAITQSLASGEPADFQARLRRFDGIYRWFHIRGLPLRDRQGRIVRWYFLNTDVNDRKRVEEELRDKEEFLAKAQRLSLSGSFSWYVDTNEVTLSEEAYRILGFELGTPVTLERIANNIHPEDRPLLAEMIGGSRGADGKQDHMIRLHLTDGTVKYLRGASEETHDAKGRKKYVGAIQDVTRRHLMEAALDKARADLAHVARVSMLSVLTASMAHEVNQPLSGIVTNAGTCLRMLDADPPNIEGARETAKRTIRDGNRASEVVKRLRALFSKKVATFESFDLNDAVKEVIALSVRELQRNKVILLLDLAADLAPVSGDRVQIQQVILNLIRNASDAMSAIDDRPRELLIKTVRDETGGVRLSVKDTGVGINSEMEDKIFEAFYTTKAEGMGIGLSVSRSIMEIHQGRLWAIRNEGPGATFLFSISCATDTKV